MDPRSLVWIEVSVRDRNDRVPKQSSTVSSDGQPATSMLFSQAKHVRGVGGEKPWSGFRLPEQAVQSRLGRRDIFCGSPELGLAEDGRYLPDALGRADVTRHANLAT
jgi:hypothetical protein